MSAFDLLAGNTSTLSLNSSTNASITPSPASLSQPQSHSTSAVASQKPAANLFDDLISGSSALQWASSTAPPAQPAPPSTVPQRKPSVDEWDAFTSAPPASSNPKPVIPPEDDLFANVWK
jgi:hypothetical protein